MDRVLGQLASNKRVNSAKDDPAGLAVINKLKATVNSLKSANENNITMGENLLNVADTAVQQISDKWKDLQSLAQQASDPLLSDEKRADLQIQFKQGLEDFNDLATQTSFNGHALLDGSLNADLQTGSETGQSVKLHLNSLTTKDLDLSDLSIGTVDNANKALKYLTAAQPKIDTVSSQINALSKSLEFRQNANALQIENLGKARSEIEDLDIPEATSELSLQRTLYQSQISLLRSSLDSQEGVFQLLWRK